LLYTDMNNEIEYIGKFIYSENDIVYETVMAETVTEAIEKLHSKSDWDNSSYELQTFIRVS